MTYLFYLLHNTCNTKPNFSKSSEAGADAPKLSIAITVSANLTFTPKSKQICRNTS